MDASQQPPITPSQEIPTSPPEQPPDATQPISKSPVNKLLIVGILIFTVLFLAGVIFLVKSSQTGQSTGGVNETMNTTTQVVLPTISGSPTSTATGNSDDQLDKDSASVDAQLKGLDTDTASIDQGLNDQQIDVQL